MVSDLAFYIFHRLLHSNHPWFPLYRWVHKQHHEFSSVISVVCLYMHPFEYAGTIICGFLLPMSILGRHSHFSFVISANLINLLDICHSHSGYEFPWYFFQQLPFQCDVAFHDFHHTKNRGNFGIRFNFWDTMFNTNVVYVRSLKNPSDNNLKI